MENKAIAMLIIDGLYEWFKWIVSVVGILCQVELWMNIRYCVVWERAGKMRNSNYSYTSCTIR